MKTQKTKINGGDISNISFALGIFFYAIILMFNTSMLPKNDILIISSYYLTIGFSIFAGLTILKNTYSKVTGKTVAFCVIK